MSSSLMIGFASNVSKQIHTVQYLWFSQRFFED